MTTTPNAPARPRRNKRRPPGGWAGESHREREAAGQRRWAVWLDESDSDRADALRARLGVTRTELVRLALERLEATS